MNTLTKNFIERIKQYHKEYDYSQVEYINSRTKVKIICPKHGEFFALPGNLLKGSGCKKCSSEQSKKNQSKSVEQFVKEAKEIYGDKYDYSLVEYKNAITKVKIICKEHNNIFEQTPAAHLKGIGCKQCLSELLSSGGYKETKQVKDKQTRKKTTEQFIEKAKQIHGDKYDYSLVEYKNTDTKVKIICPEHGVFEQTPYVHINLKCGCKRCSEKKISEERKFTKEQFIEKANQIHHNFYDYSKIDYVNMCSKIKIICPKHGEFEMLPYNHIYSMQNCPKCVMNGTSQQEQEILNFIKTFYGGEIITNDRKVLEGKELDLYFPKENLAIEYDGLFWHNNIDNSYKFEECRKKGIRLIRITEPEWIRQKYKIKYFLQSTFGVFEKRIFARKCEIKEINNEVYKSFCNENHLQGYSVASVRFGLFFEGQLIQIMSFGKPRFNKKIDWELIRECSKLGYSIIGGKEKLEKYFERKYNPKNILSYCEKDKFSGKSYYRNGFKLISESKPGYTYYYGKDYIPLSRIAFQKYKLKNKLEKFDEKLTEWENMSNNGYKRLFDYGNYIFLKELLQS